MTQRALYGPLQAGLPGWLVRQDVHGDVPDTLARTDRRRFPLPGCERGQDVMNVRALAPIHPLGFMARGTEMLAGVLLADRARDLSPGRPACSRCGGCGRLRAFAAGGPGCGAGAVVAEGFLDAPGGGGSDALVDGECLP